MSEAERTYLAQRLRQAREAANLSQEEVALHLGVPRPAVSQIENGRRKVEALELARLAKFYGRPMSYFADDSEGTERMEVLHRTASALSDRDREEVLRFAEFLRERASTPVGKP